MRYEGRTIDPVELWSRYVQFPPNMDVRQEFAPLVQCPNPEHHTQKRHFQVNLKKPLVHCFTGCGISGTYEHAIAMIEGVSLRGARKIVLRHAQLSSGGVDIAPAHRGRKKSVDRIVLDREAFERGEFSYLPASARAYLDSRGISESSRTRFAIGYDEEAERVVIPAFDRRGQFAFLIRRSIGSELPKYLYTDGSDKSSLLFGACFLDRELVTSRGLILVEGSLDAIRLHQHGFTNAVAILGSKLSKKQSRIIERISPPKVYLMFDKDVAGISATNTAIRQLIRLPVFVCRYPKGKSDPAELTRKETMRQVERAMPLLQYKRILRNATV